MILVVDNYDSFTYNIVQLLAVYGNGLPVRVIRNDRITPDDAATLGPSHLIISPGPCTPNQAGASMALITTLMGKVPILGICLGHQCIAQVFGAAIMRSKKVVHGKRSRIWHDGSALFAGMPNPFLAARYHSLSVDMHTLPDDLQVTAWTDAGEVMGLSHKTQPIVGLQFHPESFLTANGWRLIANFLGCGFVVDPVRRSAPLENELSHGL